MPSSVGGMVLGNLAVCPGRLSVPQVRARVERRVERSEGRRSVDCSEYRDFMAHWFSSASTNFSTSDVVVSFRSTTSGLVGSASDPIVGGNISCDILGSRLRWDASHRMVESDIEMTVSDLGR
jgi:hypothetical protein